MIAIFLRSIREVAAQDYNRAQIEACAHADRSGWRARRFSRPTWVAADGERIKGFSDLEPDGHLDMMFIHPDYQGCGIATSLLSVVEAAAGERRLPLIFTEASITARPFFAKRGSEVITQQEVAVRGQFLRNFPMHKTLS